MIYFFIRNLTPVLLILHSGQWLCLKTPGLGIGLGLALRTVNGVLGLEGSGLGLVACVACGLINNTDFSFQMSTSLA